MCYAGGDVLFLEYICLYFSNWISIIFNYGEDNEEESIFRLFTVGDDNDDDDEEEGLALEEVFFLVLLVVPDVDVVVAVVVVVVDVADDAVL
jgi:hypothetical protein